MFKNRKLKKTKKQLKKYVVSMTDEDVDKQEIISKLEYVGWGKDIIDEVFDEIEKEKKDMVEITIPLKKKKEEEPQEEETPKKGGLASQVRELNEKIDIIAQTKKQERKFKKKQFKLPFQVKSQLKKLALKHKVQVMLLQRNRNIKPTIGEIKDGMLIIDKQTIHDCPMDCVGLWNGKIPTVILPEWDLEPLSLSKLYKDTLENKRLSDPQKIIIRQLEFKESLMPKKISVKGIVIAIVITVIVLAVMWGGGFV